MHTSVRYIQPHRASPVNSHSDARRGPAPAEPLGLGPLVSISDPLLERMFWESGKAMDLCTTVDRWSFWLLLMNLLSLVNSMRTLVPYGMPIWGAVACPMASLAHTCYSRLMLTLRPQTYRKHRAAFAVTGRLLRLTTLTFIAWHVNTASFFSMFLPPHMISAAPVQQACASNTTSQAAAAMPSLAAHTDSIHAVALRRLCIVGLAITPIFTAQLSMLLPLSFWPNAVMHTASLLLGWRMLAPKMACALRGAATAPRMRQWCETLAAASRILGFVVMDSTLLLGGQAPGASAGGHLGVTTGGVGGGAAAQAVAGMSGGMHGGGVCAEGAVEVLMVWAHLALGLLLPLGVACYVERACKLRWLVSQRLRPADGWMSALGWSAHAIVASALVNGLWAASEVAYRHGAAAFSCDTTM